jgi:hypothetical protein
MAINKDTDTNAVYALNSYVWKLLEANLGWTKDPFGGQTPIIPASMQPEFLQKGKPFIVYGAAIQGPGHLYALRKESVAYQIYGTTNGAVNDAATLLAAAFERQDEAAADVNRHLALEAPLRQPSLTSAGGKRKVQFTTVKLTMVERAEPAETEGGYMSALVLLEIGAVIDFGAIQTSSFVY